MYQGTKNYGGFENGIAGITNRDPSVWDSVSKDPKNGTVDDRASPGWRLPKQKTVRRARSARSASPCTKHGRDMERRRRSSRTATTAATSTRTQPNRWRGGVAPLGARIAVRASRSTLLAAGAARPS